MSEGSAIEWTETTWNPVTGCNKVSLGCQHCYAERMAIRLQAMGQPNYANGFHLTCHNHMLNRPLSWTKPSMVFVNSMSDLFHEDVPFEFIRRVFDIMVEAEWHTFQVLTKRSGRLVDLGGRLPWPENVWVGVTVEHPRYLSRVDDLAQVPAKTRFLSLEPLLAPLPRLNLTDIDWVIVGGESGPGARRMEESWVTCIRDQCTASGTPFFFKQWGGFKKKHSGRILQGRVWMEMPSATSPALTG